MNLKFTAWKILVENRNVQCLAIREIFNTTGHEPVVGEFLRCRRKGNTIIVKYSVFENVRAVTGGPSVGQIDDSWC